MIRSILLSGMLERALSASAHIMRFINGKISCGSQETIADFAFFEPFRMFAFPCLSCTFPEFMKNCPLCTLPDDLLKDAKNVHIFFGSVKNV